MGRFCKCGSVCRNFVLCASVRVGFDVMENLNQRLKTLAARYSVADLHSFGKRRNHDAVP